MSHATDEASRFGEQLMTMNDDERESFFTQETTGAWKKWYDKKQPKKAGMDFGGLTDYLGGAVERMKPKIKAAGEQFVEGVTEVGKLAPGGMFRGEAPEPMTALGLLSPGMLPFQAGGELARGLSPEGGRTVTAGGAELGVEPQFLTQEQYGDISAHAVETGTAASVAPFPMSRAVKAGYTALKAGKKVGDTVRLGKAVKTMAGAVPSKVSQEISGDAARWATVGDATIPKKKAKDAVAKLNRVIGDMDESAAKAIEKIKKLQIEAADPVAKRKSAGKYPGGREAEAERQRKVAFQTTTKSQALKKELDLAKAQVNAHIKNGGTTFGAEGDLMGQDLAAMSIRKTIYEIPGGKRPTASDFLDFQLKHKELLKTEGHAVGSYYNKTTQLHELSVSKVSPDRMALTREAFQTGENSIFDLKTAQDIPVRQSLAPMGKDVEVQRPLEVSRKPPKVKPGEGDALDLHRRDTEGKSFLDNERGAVKLPDVGGTSNEKKIADAWEAGTSEVEGNIRQISKTVEIMKEYADDIARPGGFENIPKPVRADLTAAKHAEIPNLRDPSRKISVAETQMQIERVNALERFIRKTRSDLRMMDLASDMPEANPMLIRLSEDLTSLEETFKATAIDLAKTGNTWGDIGRVLNQKISPETMARIRQVLDNAGHVRRMKAGKPLYEAIADRAKQIGSGKKLSRAEWGKLVGDIADAWRFNLFSTTSFTLDTMGNFSEFSAQAGGLLGRDIYKAAASTVKGTKIDLSFEGMHSIKRALRRRFVNANKKLGQGIDPKLGGAGTAYGEQLGAAMERGIFLSLNKGGSRAAAEYLISAPLRAKGAVDTFAKRLGFSMQVEMELGEMANKLGKKGLDKLDFIEDAWKNLPDEMIERAVVRGNKMGFNRELTEFEKWFSGQAIVKFGLPFPRWPMQFTRAVSEWLGVNANQWKKMYAQGKQMGQVGEHMAEQFTKMLTGWTGVYFITQALYDEVDLETLEVVHEDGNRTRLAARDPIPTMLFFSAIMQGNWEDARKLFNFTSLPGSSLGGQSGMIGGAIRVWEDMSNDPNKTNSERFWREVNKTMEKAIPGQAVLKSLRYLMDPSQRVSGSLQPFAQLPILSYGQREKIDPTTGEVEVRREKMLGADVTPISQGQPMPGGEMQLNPVRALLNRFKMTVYKMPKKALQGKMPREWTVKQKDEYWKLFGMARQQLLGPLAVDLRVQGKLGPESFDEYEDLRLEIQGIDNAAMNQAYWQLYSKYGNEDDGKRRLTGREKLGPRAGRRKRSREAKRR